MFWQSLKIAILNYLQGAAVKAALQSSIKKLIRMVFKNATFGGIKGWLLKLLVQEVILDKAILPLVKKTFRELGYGYRTVDGHILWKKLGDAENENDQDAYDDIVNDIMR